MEKFIPQRRLSDEDITAFAYMASRVEGGAELLMGQYERDYTIEDNLMRGTYELGETYMCVNDVVWGEEIIGEQPHDQLLLELARTPLFRRLQSIEQLTLPKEYATMPNSMYFSRWEHIWGSLVFVRKMVGGDDRFDDREKMILQLRTLLSDVGHTAFSHLGDWMFQGTNGGEDMHDQDLKDILRVSGIEEILERHGFNVDETAFPDVKDWVECPSPDLCVDRVDYGFREILRWGAPTIPLNMHLRELNNPQSVFEIDDDGTLLMKSEKMARYYAAGFSILPTEHWSHPVHRMQLSLFQSGIRAAVISEVEYDGSHPREVLYGIDNDFTPHLLTWPMRNLREVMKQTALTQRQIFVEGRRADLESIFGGIRDDDWTFPGFPDPLQSYTWQTKAMHRPYPPNLKIKETAEVPGEPFSWSKHGLVANLPALKARVIDPLIKVTERSPDGILAAHTQRLSECDPSYGVYLEGQRKMMAKAYRATVLMRSGVAKLIVQEHREADAIWKELVKRPRSAENLARTIRDASTPAAAHRLDVIHEVDDEWITEKRKLGHRALKNS